jgi:hypothetical protein
MKSTFRTSRACALVVAVALQTMGCSSADMGGTNKGYDSADETTDADDGGAEMSTTLRIDVVPNGSSAYGPQSVEIDISDGGDIPDLEVKLEPYRTVAGWVSGFVATPYGDVSVPGQVEASVQARVTLEAPYGLAGTSADTDEGNFALRLPRSDDYILSVVPEDGERLPFLVVDGFELENNVRGLELDLGFGVPVYGTITEDDGTAPPGTTLVWLEDIASGIRGPKVEADPNGHFMLRAWEGEYDLVIGGDDRSPIPRNTVPISVTDEPVDVSVGLGTITPVEIAGRIVDANGSTVHQATVRFTSTQLDDAAGVLVIEDDTEMDGDFDLDLLPGVWTVEIIPPYDSSGATAPLQLDELVVPMEGLDLGELELPERKTVTGVVHSVRNEAVANVVVVAREVGFDHYIYSTLTGEAGNFSFDVPDVALEVAFMPPSADESVTWDFWLEERKGRYEIDLVSGTAVSGQVTTDDGAAGSALVELRDAMTDRLYGTALTDSNGNFDLTIALNEQGGWADAPMDEDSP